jgi:hypothetical protein
VLAATEKPCLAFLRLARSSAMSTVCLSAVSVESVAAAYPDEPGIGVLTAVDPVAGGDATHWLSYCGKVRPTTAAVREGFLAGRLLTEVERHLGRRMAWEQFAAALVAIGKEDHSAIGFRRAGSGGPAVWLQVVDQGVVHQAEWHDVLGPRVR